MITDRRLNILIKSKDRPLQLKGLLDSFFLNCEDYVPTKIRVVLDTTKVYNHFFAGAYNKLKSEYSYVDFIEVDSTETES